MALSHHWGQCVFHGYALTREYPTGLLSVLVWLSGMGLKGLGTMTCGAPILSSACFTLIDSNDVS